MQGLVAAIQKDPSTAQPFNEWGARVRWQGGFKSQALVRQHTFLIDEPATLIGKDEAPNAAEYRLATGLVLNATKRGVKLRNFEITLDGRLLNILTFLGMSADGHPGFHEVVA